MKTTLYKTLFILIVSFQISCATIFNSRITKVNIHTTKPTQLILNGDTINELSEHKLIAVKRKNEKLALKVFIDTSYKFVYVDPLNSTAYKLNALLYPAYLMVVPALLIDRKKDIRYGYPRHIYLDVDSNNGKYFTERTMPIAQKNVLAISPLMFLVDFVNPSIELAYERKLTNKISLQGRFSKIISRSLLYESDFENLNGLRWGVEARYFFKGNALKGAYYGVEFNHLKSNYSTTMEFIPKLLEEDYESYYWDDFDVKKRTLNFNLKYGYQLIHRKLVFDVYGGFGIKNRNTKHSNRINLNDILVRPRHPNFFYNSNKIGHSVGINLICNIRIGYAF